MMSQKRKTINKRTNLPSLNFTATSQQLSVTVLRFIIHSFNLFGQAYHMIGWIPVCQLPREKENNGFVI